MTSAALQRARDRLAAGDVQSAKHACEAAVRESADPHSLAQAKLLLATCCQRAGDVVTALVHARDAVASDPHNALVHYGLAEIEERAGEKDAAIASVQRALAIDPAFIAAIFYLGIL